MHSCPRRCTYNLPPKLSPKNYFSPWGAPAPTAPPGYAYADSKLLIWSDIRGLTPENCKNYSKYNVIIFKKTYGGSLQNCCGNAVKFCALYNFIHQYTW